MSFQSWFWVRFWWVVVAGLSLVWYAVLRVVIVKSSVAELSAVLASLLTHGEYAPLVKFIRILGSSGDADSLYLGSSELVRKAENAFAFLDSRTESVLSLLYLHFRYVHLLLWPIELCAEYAFDCVPKVSAFTDVRNIYSVSVYGVVACSWLYDARAMFAPRNVPKLESKDKEKGKVVSIIQKADADTCNVRTDCILVAILWFVVTFVPISGVQHTIIPSSFFIWLCIF